ncbi:hypothetical protein Trydic_g19488 [Trypoxylus dichotomus]
MLTYAAAVWATAAKEPTSQSPNVPEPDATMGRQHTPVRQEHHHTSRRRNSTPNGLHPDHRNPSLRQRRRTIETRMCRRPRNTIPRFSGDTPAVGH